MNEIQSYLTRKEGDLVKEAASAEKKVNFNKKDDLFRMLREGATLQEINQYIEAKVGKLFRDWHFQKFQAIYEELQTLRKGAFDTFIRKTRIGKYGIPEEDLQELEKSIYSGKKDSVKELLSSRIKSEKADKIHQMAIDWMTGKEIESDKEEETAKITPANIEKLKGFIADTIGGFGAEEKDHAEALDIALKEDWPQLKSFIENFEMDNDKMVEDIRLKYLELVEQSRSGPSPNIPTYTEGDKARIREFIMDNMEFVEKEDVDTVIEDSCTNNWEAIAAILEKYYGEDDITNHTNMLKDFLDQQFPEIRAAQRPKEQAEAAKVSEKVEKIENVPPKQSVPPIPPIKKELPPPPPTTAVVGPPRHDPTPTFTSPTSTPATLKPDPIVQVSGRSLTLEDPAKSKATTQPVGPVKPTISLQSAQPMQPTQPIRNQSIQPSAQPVGDFDNQNRGKSTPMPPPPPQNIVQLKPVSLNPLVGQPQPQPKNEPATVPRLFSNKKDKFPTLAEIESEETQLQERIEQMLREIDESLVVNLQQNIDQPRVEELRSEDIILEFGQLPTDLGSFMVQQKPSVGNQLLTTSGAMKPDYQPGMDLQTSGTITQSGAIGMSGVISDSKPSQSKKQFYVLVKFNELLYEKNGIGKYIQLVVNSKQQYTSKLLATFDKYALFGFNTPLFTEDFWFQYSSSRKEKGVTSYRLCGNDFNQPANFMLDLPFGEYNKHGSDIARIGTVEELYSIGLLIPTDKDFMALMGFLNGKRDYKSRFANSVKLYHENNKDLETMLKEYANKKGMFYLYYLMAMIYNEQYAPDAEPTPNSNLIEKLFWDCERIENRDLSKNLEFADNTFRQVLLRINYYKKAYGKEAQLFNSLLNNYCNENLEQLIRLLYIDNGKEEKSRKFQRIERDKLFEAVKRYKTPILKHLYMMMVVLSHIAINSSTNPFDRLLDILCIVNTQSTEGQLYITEEIRPYEQILKKAIERESDKVCSGKLYLLYPNNESFIKLFKSLAELNPIFLKSLMNERLEKLLKDHIFSNVGLKNEEAVITIQRVFLQSSSMVIGWMLYEEVLRRFFYKTVTRKVTGRYGFGENIEIVQERDYLSENAQTMFASVVLYPILLRKDTIKYRKITIEHLVNSLIYSSRDFPAIARILGGPLQSQQDWREPDLKTALQSSYSTIFDMLDKAQLFQEAKLIQNKQWLNILKLQQPLRDFLLERIAKKIKPWRDSHYPQYNSLPDIMAADLFDCQTITEEERAQVMWVITDLNDQDSISLDDLRKVLSEWPQRAKQYAFVLMRGSHNVKNRIQQYVTQIKREINRESRIKRSVLTRVISHKDDSMKHIDTLFGADQGAEPLSTILKTLDNKCKQFMDELKRISNLCKAFSNSVGVALEIYQLAEDKYTEFSRGQTEPIDFYLCPELEFFRRLDPAIFSFYTSKLFQDKLELKRDMSVSEFCNNLSKGLHAISTIIGQFLIRFRDNSLTMEDAFSLNKSLTSTEDLRKLLELLSKSGLESAEKDEATDIIAIFKYNQQFRYCLNLYSAIKYIAKHTKDTLVIDDKVFTEMRNSQFHRVLAKDFLRAMQEFTSLIHRYELRVEQSDNDINKVMENTEKATELSKLIRQQIKEGQIEELKDYMNDQDDNNGLTSKNIIEFEHVYRYYMTVLNQATGFGDYLKRLQDFLLEESRSKDSESLASALDSCLQVQNQLKTILKEAGNREQSFKFKVEKLMDNSVITIEHNVETGEKDVKVNFGEKEDIAFRNLLEWRDKTLLLINAAKKNKEEVEEEILKKLDSFVRMYQALEDVLNSYNKLTDLGYFVDFVSNSILTKMEFRIERCSFDRIIDHNDTVRKECEKWERDVNVAYSKSFAFAHYQGRDLKRLAWSIGQQVYSSALQEVIPGLTEARFRDYMADPDVSFEFRRVRSPLDLLECITKMFLKFEYLALPHKALASERRLNDNRIPIRLIGLLEEKVYCGMLAPGLDTLASVNMPQILLCRENTSVYDVRTFLMRAILDSSRPYFVIGTHYLNAEIQNSFVDTIERALEHERLKQDIRRINLYMIDNSFNQRIYNYFTNHKDKLFRVSRSEEVSSEALKYFHQRAGPTKIVASSAAGLGKTFWIQQDARRQGKQLHYFPVAGNLSLSRLHQRIRDLKLTENSALVIQIHNIKDKKTLDEFLFQVVFFKCIKYDGFLYLPPNLSIYIELQNVLDQKHLEQLQVLAILSRGEGIVQHLQQAQSVDVRIDPQNRKFMFVLKYLDLLKSKSIDKEELSFSTFQTECNNGKAGMLLNQGSISELIQHYLFSPLRQAHNEPSYIQMVSFLSLMFESLNTFAQSPYYGVEVIKEYSTGDFKGSQLQSYRSKHVELLVSNSRDFLFRTITQNNFKENPTEQELQAADQFSRRLRDFPFCIVPNADENSYSFIYKEAKNVDPLIRKYTALQGGYLRQQEYTNDQAILKSFSQRSLTALKDVQLVEEMKRMLREVAHKNPNAMLKPDENYSLTLDNFFKMCLIVQRMRANIPIIIMGETGVGKTALIDHLVKNVFLDELIQFNIHAGTNEAKLIEFDKDMRTASAKLAQGKKLWVFLDEFNTTEEVGYVKEIIMERRFMGNAIPDNVVFLAACNPFRTKQVRANVIKVGIEKKHNPKAISQNMLYKVLPPPESMIEIMWNFQELKEEESKNYIETIVHSHVKIVEEKPQVVENKDGKQDQPENKVQEKPKTRPFLTYRTKEVANVIHQTHEMFKAQVEKSAVNLRDVSRFKILYCWFMANMPEVAVGVYNRQGYIDYDHNIRMDRGERAFILSICFCYYMRLGTFESRQKYLEMVEKLMGYPQKYMSKVLENEQLDYLSRMQRPKGCALNLALRENVFTCLVCLMNKLPIIIVGMPGCSKSLAIRLLVSNLRGRNSHDEFFRKLPELQLFPYQGGEACSSEGVLKVFERAENNKRHGSIPCILFDEIGLAELSVHNPLKVLHAKLQVNKTEIAFIGISNWELDASKMARFLVINRPIPDEVDLSDTAEKIFQSYEKIQVNAFKSVMDSLSKAYFRFIKEWKNKQNNDHKDFFGLRDFYSLIKYVCSRIINENVSKDNERACAEIMRRSVERNFDGRPDSIKTFLRILVLIYKHEALVERIDEQVDILDLISENISDADKNSRCLLQIVKGEALIYIINQKQVGIDKKANNNIIMLHGSTFELDKHSAEYNLLVISDIITYVARGDVVVMKDVPNSVQTSLYDLLNKSYQTVGLKNFCRVSVGAHYNPKCFVHPNFNCIVNIMEDRLKEVDPPFLNRFEKHYLTFNQFLSSDENQIIAELESWIDRLLKEHITKDNPLLSEHYIINICRESLASLAIRSIMEWQKEHEHDQNPQLDIKECIERAKMNLLLNSTTDFKLLMAENRPRNEQDIEILDRALEYKENFLKEKRLDANALIIYTYDQTAEISNDNILYVRREGDKDCTKVIQVCQLKCEKDLRSDLESFYRQPNYRVCHIKMNFERESHHLCMIVFLLDSMAKKYEHPANKRINIILVASRLTLLTNNKRYKQISYLNGFQQIFIENLSHDALDVSKVPAEGSQILDKFKGMFTFDEIIPKLFSAVVKRFNFTSRVENKPQIIKEYIELVNSLSDNNIFRTQCKEYIIGRLKQRSQKKWKREVIYNKEIANLAPTTEIAMRLCFEERFEEDLALYLNFLIENEVVYCFEGRRSVTLLKQYAPQARETQAELIRIVSDPNYTSMFEHLLKLNTPLPNKPLRKISKAVGEERREISFPKLFPFIKKERNYILQKERNNEVEEDKKENDVRTDETLEELCQKIDELDMALLNKRDEEALTNIESKLNEAKAFIARKTCLAHLVEAGQEPDYDYLKLINEDEQWAGFKKLFLLDIFNCFVQSSLQADVRDSFELQKVLKYFVEEKEPLHQQVITLLRGESLWKKLVVILRVFREVDLTHQLEQYWHGFRNPHPEQHRQNFIIRMEFIKFFTIKCEARLFPNEKNIDELGGFRNYEKIFNNVYYILEGLENEFKSSNVAVPFKLRLMRNFLKTIGMIAEENREELVAKFLKEKEDNLYMRIHKFIEEVKVVKSVVANDRGEQVEKLRYESKMSVLVRYQASNLFLYWIEDLQEKKVREGEELNYFVTEFVRLIDREEDFAHYCTNVIRQMLRNIDLTKTIAEICDDLSDKVINSDLFLSTLNRDVIEGKYDNNMAVVLVDYFCRNIDEPDVEDDLEGDAYLSQCIQSLYPNFEEVLKKVQEEPPNGVQTTAFLGFCRQFLTHYVGCLVLPGERYEKLENLNNFMNQIDELLSKDTSICKNLRMFCMKLVRSSQKSFRDVQLKYINVNRANWMRSFEGEFKGEATSKQFLIPPKTPEIPQMDRLMKQFETSGYLDTKLLEEMFRFDSPTARYKLFTMFMTEIYSGLCGEQATTTIKEFLAAAQPSDYITKFELDVLTRYANGKVTLEIEHSKEINIDKVGEQTWILNNLNWLLSIRKCASPLSSIFFDEKGGIPEKFSEHIGKQFLICGSDNPFRSIIESIASATPEVAMYICSNKCDFVYTLEGCGWPAGKSKCKFCDSDISGDGHQLLRYQNEGARRLGPNLLFKNGKFTDPNDYASANTNHSPFYIWVSNGSLRNLTAYWKSLPYYLRKEIDRIIEKPEVVITEKNIDRQNKNKIVQKEVTYKFTGYSKFTAEGLSRIHNYTNHILLTVLNSLVYFFLDFGWITDEESVKAFDNRDCNQMRIFAHNLMINESDKLKELLNHNDWASWLMGMQNIIFGMAANYPAQYQKALEEKQMSSMAEIKRLQEAKAAAKDNTHKMLIDNIIKDGTIADFPKIEDFTARKCWNRDFFEKLVEAEVTKFCSGQDKINFIKQCKSIKGELAYPFDAVLLEENIDRIKDFSFLRVLRLAINPNYKHMTKQYSMRISQEFPILDFLLSNLGKIDNISLYWNVMNFVNEITNYVEFSASRNEAKSISACDYINALRVPPERKTELLVMLDLCCSSWNALAKMIGVVQYECKVLGAMNDTYTKDEKLIAFLVETVEATNYFGKMMSGVMHLFAAAHNQLIGTIEAKKQTITQMKDVQLFSENQYLPQKITGNDIIRLDTKAIETLVASSSSSSVKYSNGIPLYNFDLIQYKLTNGLYGKKRLVTDMKHYSSVSFAGEGFTRAGKYSNYITEVRQAGANRALDPNDKERIRAKFQDIKQKNDNNFFNFIRGVQGFIEKIMIYYKNLPDKNTTIGDFINKYGIRNPPEIMLEFPIKALYMENIVGLYEEVEGQIFTKIFAVLPDEYRKDKLNPEQRKLFGDFFTKMRSNEAENRRDNDMPTLEEFRTAFYRLAARCLILAEIPNNKMLMEFLPARLDFWPYMIDDIKLEMLPGYLGTDVELSKAFDLYEMIENIGKPPVKEAIKPVVQGEKIEIKVGGGVQRKRVKGVMIRE